MRSLKSLLLAATLSVASIAIAPAAFAASCGKTGDGFEAGRTNSRPKRWPMAFPPARSTRCWAG